MSVSAALKQYVGTKKKEYEFNARDFVVSQTIFPMRGYTGGMNRVSGQTADKENLEILRAW
jgi:hypothetical protein